MQKLQLDTGAKELPTRQESLSVLLQDKSLDMELKAGISSAVEPG